MTKTEITIPNPIFESARQLAQRLDMSMSELYTAALAAYVATYQDEGVTEKLHELYEIETSSLDPGLVALQVASMRRKVWLGCMRGQGKITEDIIAPADEE